VNRLINEDIPESRRRRHSDRQNARIEHDKALGRVMTAVLKDASFPVATS
jgi:type I restriction enzyme, R subunit